MNSVSMQVAERSLFLWNNEYIVSLVAQHRQVILPVVFNALESNARSHWNPAVHGLTSNVKKVFQDMDMNLWRECEAHYQQEEVCTFAHLVTVLFLTAVLFLTTQASVFQW